MANAPATQQKSTIHLDDISCRATGSLQWKLETKNDESTPVFQYNNLTVHICGEDSFAAIAKDLLTAEKSIDIIAWGFDPAMELIRKPGVWGERGLSYGDLLRDAAANKKVQVRLLVWYDEFVKRIAGTNMPGYKTTAGYEASAAAWRGAVKGPGQSVEQASLPPAAEAQFRREVFNSHWFNDVVAGKVDGLSLRTRGSVHEAVVATLEAEALASGAAVKGIERLGLEVAATHHQKTIVIDYDGARPRAYVMGLNSITEYWDTAEHVFNDPKRGENYEGNDSDHSVGKGWESASAGQPTLKPYQDYVCRIEGEAVAAVYKNFVEAWNQGRTDSRGAGQAINATIDLKKLPKRLTQNLTAASNRAQILRTLPDKEGGERSIERLYFQASSFARHYLYIENQYFQNTDWARALRDARQKFVAGCTGAATPVPVADIPVLHVMVVIPTPERAMMVPRTADTVAELGHGDSVPGQEKMVRQEIETHRAAEQEMADYQKKRAAYDAKKLPFPYPYLMRLPQPLSPLALSYEKAGGAKQAQATREVLSKELGMRTLVASLWTYDKAWSVEKLPVSRRIEEDKRKFAQQKKEWDQTFEGRPGPHPPYNPIPTQRLPDRSQELKNATAQRYREIYIHSKLMIIDDSMFTLGSANLNLRSFAIDSEMNIASDDAPKSADLRKRVWAQHTKGRFDGGGDATDQKVIFETFSLWIKEASDNLINKKKGLSLTSFLVKFLDERTSTIRGG